MLHKHLNEMYEDKGKHQQYIFNNYGLEVENSFFIEDNDAVYELLFNYIVGEEV